MGNKLSLRPLRAEDCTLIAQAFVQQGWYDKPASQYQRYLEEQNNGLRDVILAEVAGEFAGYVTIQWASTYSHFKERNIPEVVDFNVLKKFQRRGIGNTLMEEAEARIKKVSPVAGIGVGTTPDYGPAHILYIKRGYIPLGYGLTIDGKPLGTGEKMVQLDHVVIHFTKFF